MKLVIKLVLWVFILILSYQLYQSIIGPVHFNEAKEERYVAVIAQLKDIKAGQEAFQEVTGSFSANFDSLVRFLDTAEFAITARRDTSYADVAKNRAFGLDAQKGGYYIEDIIIDTLSFVAIKDSLYPKSNRYQTMMNIPNSEAQYELRAGKLDRNGTIYSVFEARASKDIILAGLNPDLISQEKQVNSVDGVNGPYVKVGAMDDVNTSGNWPKLYYTAKDK